jgi:hypothetical protein
MKHGFDWVYGLFVLRRRTFPGHGAKPLFPALISATADTDNSLTAPVCPAHMAAQQAGPWQDEFPAFS